MAIEALQKERKAWAPEANMHKAGIVSFPTERAKRNYDELSEAIAELQELGKRHD